MAEQLSTMPSLPLTVGMQVKFEAISPSTGLAVAGVTVSNAVIYADDSVDEGPDKFDTLPPLLAQTPSAVAGS